MVRAEHLLADHQSTFKFKQWFGLGVTADLKKGGSSPIRSDHLGQRITFTAPVISSPPPASPVLYHVENRGQRLKNLGCVIPLTLRQTRSAKVNCVFVSRKRGPPMNSTASIDESPVGTTLGQDQTRSLTPTETQHRRFVRRIFALLTKRTFVLLSIALLVLIAALISEHLAAQPNAPGIISINTLSELLREAAFAFLIAFAVIATVELESREEREQKAERDQRHFLKELENERTKFNQTVDATLKQIQSDVFRATFQRRIPKRIVDEVNELVFTADFVRTDHHQTLTLRNITAADLDTHLGSCDLVKLEVQGDYTVENVSGVAKAFDIRLVSEKPPDKVLQEYVTAELLSLWLDGHNINIGHEKVDQDEHTLTKTWKVEGIPPDSTLRVLTKQVMIKYPNDYAAWRSGYPTCGLKYTVEFPEQVRVCDAEALHRTPLVRQRLSERKFDYLVSGPVLPHQGVLVWWCCKPTGLDDQKAASISAGQLLSSHNEETILSEGQRAGT
jgi:hypothetical protein